MGFLNHGFDVTTFFNPESTNQDFKLNTFQTSRNNRWNQATFSRSNAPRCCVSVCRHLAVKCQQNNSCYFLIWSYFYFHSLKVFSPGSRLKPGQLRLSWCSLSLWTCSELMWLLSRFLFLCSSPDPSSVATPVCLQTSGSALLSPTTSPVSPLCLVSVAAPVRLLSTKVCEHETDTEIFGVVQRLHIYTCTESLRKPPQFIFAVREADKLFPEVKSERAEEKKRKFVVVGQFLQTSCNEL